MWFSIWRQSRVKEDRPFKIVSDNILDMTRVIKTPKIIMPESVIAATNDLKAPKEPATNMVEGQLI